MSDWVTAVFGLAGAGVGAGAAMWGAWRAARMSQEALAVQIRKEDERWIRDQRQAAYQAMLDADHHVHEAIMAASGNPDGGLEDVDAALKRSDRAARLIEIPGPHTVVDAATRLWSAHADWAVVEVRGREGRLRYMEAMKRRREAVAAFRQAARSALGYAEFDASELPSAERARRD
ncbi:hypothetical protein [Streptomyces sp. NPDC087294]|uniref:hypothetical protein n=1 Tax=Streptomyces sp. NPDC087294 TaxID=3365777 RepID=UPI0037F50C1F